jgi:hypothetical protein
MKTRKVLLTALMAVFVSVLALAKEPVSPTLVVVNQKSGIFKVIYQNNLSGKVSMRIQNTRGDEVFYESIWSANGFIRPVNFDGMSPGEYTIEVTDANGKQSQKVDYAFESSVTSVRVSKMATEGKYLLAVANSGTELINVRIFDGGDNLVHNESITINGDFSLVYNLKQVVGIPTFEVTDKTGNTQVIKE